MKKPIMALATATLLLLAFALPASAHVPSVSLSCKDGAQVHLTNYNTDGDNSVVVTLDGNEVANEDDFGASFDYSKDGLDPYVGHTLHVVVDAWDDPESDKGFSIDVTKEIGPCSHKVFVCKYVGKPGVDERLQTGQNPIDVDEHAIPDFDGDNLADLVGKFFADAQGRSLVLAIDVGQDEPSIEDCPPGDSAPEPPVLRVTCDNVTVAGITEGWQVIVEPGDHLLVNGRNPLEPGEYTYELRFKGNDIKGGEFEVKPCGQVEVFAAPCPANIPPGTTVPSRLRIIAAILIGLHVSIDGVEVTPDAQGEVAVIAGTRHVTVLAADGETVLFDDDVVCPTCSAAAAPTPTPDKTAPPTDVDTSIPPASGGILPLLIILSAIGGAAIVLTRKRV